MGSNRNKDWKAASELSDKVLYHVGDYLSKVEIIETKCKFCGSTDVVKNGHRKGTQYWLCRHCGHGFVNNATLPKSRFPIDMMSKALYDYFAGVSLNGICEGIRQSTGEPITDTTIYGWLQKYIPIALNEATKHPPKVGKRWVMDETVVSLNGKKYWLITALDEDTRFLVGVKISSNRNKNDIRELLEHATDMTGVIPDEILTDGWVGYPDAIELAYGADSHHIQSKPFAEADMSTNLMERWNGTLKDRLKPMRGMDRNTSFQLILEGFVFFYNYLRPHSGIGGRTPAEAGKAGYPWKSWGDVVNSQKPKVVVPKGTKVEYRVRRKKKAIRRARKARNMPTSMRGIQG
jgi:transposase-like protein